MTCCNGKTIQKQPGPHIGEYCSDCGKWIRWVPQEKDGEYILWAVDNLKGSMQRKCKQAIEETKNLVKESLQ